MVAEMLEAGIIRLSQISYCAPVVMVLDPGCPLRVEEIVGDASCGVPLLEPWSLIVNMWSHE